MKSWRIQSSALIDRLTEGKSLYREIEALFPNRVRSIVIAKDGVQLVLSDDGNASLSDPPPVSIRKTQHSRSVITFSGQQIEINGEECDLLSDGRGNVIVVGANLLWSVAEHRGEMGHHPMNEHPVEAS